VQSFVKKITVAARDSALSKAQTEEVLTNLRYYRPDIVFEPIFVKTTGDLDLKTPLTGMEKTNFFTKEVDELVLTGLADVGIHSAKDLSDPIAKGLVSVAYTEGVDPSDVIVFRKGESLKSLPPFAKVGTSSVRRQENLLTLRKDFSLVQIRGTIERRLSLLDEGEVDALVMAKAALIRLKIVRDSIHLPGPSAEMQGRLAVLAREGDLEMKELFSLIDKK